MEFKGYNIMHLGTFPMVEIKAKGQGKVPKPLTGMFTTQVEAQRAITGYLEGLKKGKRNGSTKGTSTG